LSGLSWTFLAFALLNAQSIIFYLLSYNLLAYKLLLHPLNRLLEMLEILFLYNWRKIGQQPILQDEFLRKGWEFIFLLLFISLIFIIYGNPFTSLVLDNRNLHIF